MAIVKACRLAVLLVGCASLVACAGIDWEEVAAAQEREIASIERWSETVEPILTPPSGNAGSEAWVAYQVRMAAIAHELQGMRPDTLRTVLVYAAERQKMPLEIVDRVLAALQVAGSYGLLPGQSSRRGGSFTVKADGESRIENLDVTMGDGSPFVTGNENATAVDEGQIQNGDGQLTRSTSRPFFQPEPEAEGDINNMSEGFGVNAP